MRSAPVAAAETGSAPTASPTGAVESGPLGLYDASGRTAPGLWAERRESQAKAMEVLQQMYRNRADPAQTRKAAAQKRIEQIKEQLRSLRMMGLDAKTMARMAARLARDLAAAVRSAGGGDAGVPAATGPQTMTGSATVTTTGGAGGSAAAAEATADQPLADSTDAAATMPPPSLPVVEADTVAGVEDGTAQETTAPATAAAGPAEQPSGQQAEGHDDGGPRPLGAREAISSPVRSRDTLLEDARQLARELKAMLERARAAARQNRPEGQAYGQDDTRTLRIAEAGLAALRQIP
ncbi:hypothetical protein [Oleisolibacter albus]|uniref:hypothetical protein n=1 Tax=Oleisolibacter albus TaxID=2171757 RepID=UPI0012D84F50|nr:hypothetical protein [Oleisolibacter albus]